MTYQPGIITTVAGTGERGYSGDGGAAAEALLSEPFMCAFDAAGNLYVAEAMNHCVRRVDVATGVIATIGGTGAEGYSGDGGPATEATFNQPYSLQVDGNGDVYVVDRLNYVIRKIDAATGVISTVAGTGEPGYGGDGGPGTEAQFREPNDCFLDGRGGLLIADVQDQRIRLLDLASGIITTFAGNGEKVRGGDGRPATEASILGARAVCMDGAGNTYIAEREGNGIRKVDANGIMSTLAGTGEFGYGGDGGPGLHRHLGRPQGHPLRPRWQRAGGGHREPRHPPHRCGHQPRAHHRRRAAGRRGRRRPGRPGGNGPPPRLRRGRCNGNIYIADSNNHRVRVVGAG